MQNLPPRVRDLLHQSWPWALIAFAVMLVVYTRTLLPGTVGGDAGELQYAGPILSIAHSTGYPLYVILGFIWSKVIVIGTVAYRMNLLAAVSGAAGCAIVSWMVHRLSRNAIIAVACGLTLGFGATYWQQAVIADKYAFNTIFVALVVGLALWWAGERQGRHGDRLLYALSLAYGVSFLHHRTMILLAPGLLLLVISLERGALWRKMRRSLICLGLVIAPSLIVYPIYLPLAQARNLSPIAWRPHDIPGWIDWLLWQQYSLAAFAPEGLGTRLVYYGSMLIADYPGEVLGIAALGSVLMIRRRWAIALFLFISFILQAALSANYRAYELPYFFFLPSFIILIYAYGLGLHDLWEMVKARLQGSPGWAAGLGVLAGAALFVIPAVQLLYAYPIRRHDATYGQPLDVYRQVLKNGTMGDRLVARMDDLPQDAIVLADWEQLTILWYKQKVEGVRPDLTLLYPIEQLGDFASDSRPVCLARMLPIGEEWHPTNMGPLVCLNREPDTSIPDDFTLIGKPLVTSAGDPRLELAAYRLDLDTIPAGRYMPVVLAWRALIDHPEDYSISLHILTESWQQVWAQDIAAPVLGMYPTSRWVQDEVVMDYHELAIPREMAPGRYLWTVVVYRQLADGSFEQLRDADGSIEVLGGTFEVTPR